MKTGLPNPAWKILLKSRIFLIFQRTICWEEKNTEKFVMRLYEFKETKILKNTFEEGEIK